MPQPAKVIDDTIELCSRFVDTMHRARFCNRVAPIEETLGMTQKQRLNARDRSAVWDAYAEFIAGIEASRDAYEQATARSETLATFMRGVRGRRQTEGEPPDYSRSTRAAKARRR
jgi:hypothetical protein